MHRLRCGQTAEGNAVNGRPGTIEPWDDRPERVLVAVAPNGTLVEIWYWADAEEFTATIDRENWDESNRFRTLAGARENVSAGFRGLRWEPSHL